LGHSFLPQSYLLNALNRLIIIILHQTNLYSFVVIAKPARAVALLLGDHDSSHASTDPLGGFHCPSGPGRPISLVVGPDNVSTGGWVVDVETGRRGSGGPWAPGYLVVVSQRDRRGRYDGRW